MHETCGNWSALTRSGKEVWDLDPRTRECQDLGLGDSGTRGLGDSGTRGLGDSGTGECGDTRTSRCKDVINK